MAMSEKSQIHAIYRNAPLPHRQTMLVMRKTILSIIPEAEEVISYGMPAFRVDGNVIAGILNAKSHVGYYPFSGSILKLFPKELRKYSTTKSAIHVPIDEPLSKTLLTKLVKARLSQCPIKNGGTNRSNYSRLDDYWKSIGVAAPARRGLVDNQLLQLSDLKKWTKKDFLKIHAIGPKAAQLIYIEMKRNRVNFRK